MRPHVPFNLEHIMIRQLSVCTVLTGIVALAACGGFKSTWPTVTGVSDQTVSVTVNCMAEQAKSLGYDVRVVDHKRGIEATRNDTSDVRYVERVSPLRRALGHGHGREGEHEDRGAGRDALALRDAPRHDANGRARARRSEAGCADDR